MTTRDIPDTFGFSKNTATLSQVYGYYHKVKRTLDEKYDQFGPMFSAYFIGRQLREVQGEHKKLSRELNIEACLALLSVVEATLRTDFICRVKRQERKNPDDEYCTKVLSQYDKLYKVRIKEDLIDYWKGRLAPMVDAHHFNIMKERIDYRNWIAHGRYWKSFGNAGRDKFSFESLYFEVSNFMAEIDSYLLKPYIIGEKLY